MVVLKNISDLSALFQQEKPRHPPIPLFSYATNEALHLSDKEKSNLRDCVARLRSEIAENTDNHSQTLIVSNLELLLNYCRRYYDRQFITRKSANSSLLAQFESELDAWFRSGEKSGAGLPSVKSLAEKLHVSPNYPAVIC
jgi:hypothetical protein